MIMIEKLKVKNYKILKDVQIELHDTFNILVGQNESGKSTVLEAIEIATTGRLHFYPFERQLRTNIFNNKVRKEYMDEVTNFNNHKTSAPKLPQIIIELYLKDDDSTKEYIGANNELRENCPGIRVKVGMNEGYSEYYKKLLQNGLIHDIPIELYKVSYNYFDGRDVLFRFSPVKSVLIDASHKNYSNMVSHFINSNIDEILTDEEKIKVSREYRKNRYAFKNNKDIEKLNNEVSKRHKFDERSITIEFKEETIDAWKDNMTISLDEVPFDNVGFGTQNVIKTELAIQNSPEKINVLLMEEPENNLSYTNMTKMLHQIKKITNKQIIIATHSSYVANVLSLQYLLLVNNGTIQSFNELPDNTYKFFQKLSGYDTLRAVLANKIIFVEGPSDELIIERCYFDKYQCLPIHDGIDIIIAGGLTFKRFCDITIFMKKSVVVLTDNDGKPDEVKNRYEDYIDNKYVHFYWQKDAQLHTLEPSIIAVNSEVDENNQYIPKIDFQHIVNYKNKEQMTFKALNQFMVNNKVEWALRVFESEKTIHYPKYIIDGIEYVKQHC